MQQLTTEAAPALRSPHDLTNGQLALVTIGRLAFNVAYRIVYPLLPFLSNQLRVDLQTVSMLVTVQVVASLASPLGGALADRRGERATMSLGLALFCTGTALCAISGSFTGFLLGYLLIGLTGAFYQPAAQAYLSARTPYARRGWALGLFETSWALAALLGIAPLMQLVQATGSATLVFWVLLAAGAISLTLISFVLPPTPRRRAAAQPGEQRARPTSVLRMPRVLAMLGLMALSMAAVDLIFVIQAAWLKTSFGADEARLGQVFGMLGIAELIGAIGSAQLVDRLGKKRAVAGAFTLTALCMAALPLSNGVWPLFLALFFLFDLCFEFAVVSSSPLASGLAPAARGTVMALIVATNGVSRAAGSLISEPLWSTSGIAANALLGATMMLSGVLLCWVFVRETEAEPEGVNG